MREIILINITGKDKPGLTASLTNILAQYEVTILDIGQAVIHDYLSLGILVEIPSAHRSSSILKDLLFQAHELGIQIRFDYFGEFLQKRLNLDYVFANGLEIESGKVTGNVSGDIIDGVRKAEILKTIATVENISLQQTICHRRRRQRFTNAQHRRTGHRISCQTHRQKKMPKNPSPVWDWTDCSI
jgi:predicted amino acid-binding ACT domain protein